MSSVMDFLEMIGRDVQLRHASRAEMTAAMAHLQIETEIQAAILAQNQEQLEALVGTKNVCCLWIPGQVSCLLIPGINDEDEPHQELRA